MYKSNKPELKNYRKKLRKNLTPAEAFLWSHLKNKQLNGRRFRRQFSIHNHILDFYCPAEKLAIELDGEEHFTPDGSSLDLVRDGALAKEGIRVIRIENKVLFENTKHVIECIIAEFKEDS